MMSHRGAVFALLTVALWAPELHLLLTKSVDPTGALVRMGAAVLVAWIAVSLVSGLVASYQARNQHGQRPAIPDEDRVA